MESLESLHEKGAKFVLNVTRKSENNAPSAVRSRCQDNTREAELALNANAKVRELSFALKVLDVTNANLFVKPVRVGNNLISFRHENVDKLSMNLWAFVDDMAPVLYQDVSIKEGHKYSEDVDRFLNIEVRRAPRVINKRTSFRCAVNEVCQIQLGNNKGIVHGILKDISLNGFAVEVKSDANAIVRPKIDLITVSIKDEKVSDNLITVSGVCVRYEENDKTITYGVHAPVVDKDYKAYVRTKQTARCRS